MLKKNKIFLIIFLFIILFFINITNSYATSYEITLDGRFFNIDFGNQNITDYVFFIDKNTNKYTLAWITREDCYLGLRHENDYYSIICFQNSKPGDTLSAFNCHFDIGSYDNNSSDLVTYIKASGNSAGWPKIYSYNSVFSSVDLKDLEDNLVFPAANRQNGTGSDTSGDGTGDTGEDSGSDEDTSSGWLSRIWDTITNIFSAIGNLASNIASAIGTVLNLVFEPLFDFVGKILNLLSDFVDYLLPGGDKWFVSDLLSFLGSLLKDLFVPEDDFFSDKINSLKDDLNSKIPIDNYIATLEEIENAGSTSTYSDDIPLSVDLNNYNLLDKIKITLNNFIDFSIFSNYKDTWYSWVRVFIYIMLVIYNVNEIIKFLRGFSITNGSGKEPVGTGFYMSDGSRNPNFKGFGKGD